ncbi:MAG: DUF2249 domain-containing protein [Deltaproteobacteria bacterium]|nr:DUF2249 domain-containing protein [Deltaproteobacteria bacterium]
MKKETLTIDCREMQPPEPFVKVLQMVNDLKADEEIIMINRHEPGMLFTKLKELEMSYEVEKKPDGHVEIRIWKEN